MASLKREEEFRINHQKYKDLMKHFHAAFWLAIVPSAGVLVPLLIYYFIRTLAMLAGGSAFMGQIIMNYAKDSDERSPLSFTIPYLYVGFLAVISITTFAAFYFKLRKPHKFLFCVYLAGAIYGLVGLFRGTASVLTGLYLIIYGIYGMWLQDFILRLHKELDELSLKEGFPDFIAVINEPRPMANTSGLYYSRSEFLKRQQKEKKESGENEPQNFEMEELTMETKLPKSKHKIDSMM